MTAPAKPSPPTVEGRRAARERTRPILLATDGSPSAADATSCAVDLAASTGRPLTIVAAWNVPPPLLAFAPFADLPQLEERARDAADSAAKHAAALASATGVQARTLVKQGPAIETIVGAASEEDAAMVVVGARGAAASESPVGSTSSGVLARAARPVLVVHDEDRAVTRRIAHKLRSEVSHADR